MNDTKPTLYIVATPIGNMEDITFRAVRTLKEVDVVLAEDTRMTGKLLARYEIKTKMMRYDAHSTEKSLDAIIKFIEDGKNIALVTDAGTPAISDPGSKLVRDLVAKFGAEVTIVPIPGASALTAALSVAGITDSSFVFLGFPPQKKGRKTFFEECAEEERVIVLYESPHRFMKAIESLKTVLSTSREVIICRELTKIHEEIVRGTSEEIQSYFTNHPDHVRGEFVVVISGK